MPKSKTTADKASTKKEEFKVPKTDEIEFKRFVKKVTRATAHRVDPDIKFLREFNMHEVRFASPQQSAIMDTFNFKHEETAKHCVQLAAKML